MTQLFAQQRREGHPLFGLQSAGTIDDEVIASGLISPVLLSAAQAQVASSALVAFFANQRLNGDAVFGLQTTDLDMSVDAIGDVSSIVVQSPQSSAYVISTFVGPPREVLLSAPNALVSGPSGAQAQGSFLGISLGAARARAEAPSAVSGGAIRFIAGSSIRRRYRA